MTREEAIEILTEHKNEYFHTSRIENAIDIAIEALSAETATLNHEKVRITDTDSVEKVQSEQVTGKLKNPCDSLLTDDSAECKEQKSKLDLISRADVVNEIQRYERHFNTKLESLYVLINELPSAEAEETVPIIPIEIKKPFQIDDSEDYEPKIVGNAKYVRSKCEVTDLISRADAFGAVQDHFNADGFKGYDDGQKMMDRIKALPSADRPSKEGER